ncbi:DUF411 domain-containing protein [Azospirillum halopraeferens]|uniref:DUF411 domain-containing protein n=1 Tax=Azospirillum halopraeferens TaxID=34010 RepID=UPI000417B311|nr:DUF411 domain-containing protein [Azospirillum halopraeferens]
MMPRKYLLSLAAAAVAVGAVVIGTPVLTTAPAAAGTVVEVWKSPSCGCCGAWIDHMKEAGFTLRVHDMDDVWPLKMARGVPETMGSCHTAEVGGYLLEGHVPAADVRRMLSEKPAIKGLAVPGMPQSAPGMDIPGEPYEVLTFGGSAGTTVYARY